RLLALAQGESDWESHFERLDRSPIRVAYEDLEQAPLKVANDVLAHLGLPSQSHIGSDLMRQRTDVNQSFSDRFREDLVHSGLADSLPTAIRARCGLPC